MSNLTPPFSTWNVSGMCLLSRLGLGRCAGEWGLRLLYWLTLLLLLLLLLHMLIMRSDFNGGHTVVFVKVKSRVDDRNM